MDSIPREGDKNYKKKRTLKLDGFDDCDNEYYEAMSARIDYMGNIYIWSTRLHRSPLRKKL